MATVGGGAANCCDEGEGIVGVGAIVASAAVEVGPALGVVVAVAVADVAVALTVAFVGSAGVAVESCHSLEGQGRVLVSERMGG
jgi:hypothetical protein